MDLSGNSLSQLPDTLGAFTSLLILKLNDSRLSGAALAPLARGMPALRELYMSKNVVTFAPEEVAGEGGGGEVTHPGDIPSCNIVSFSV